MARPYLKSLWGQIKKAMEAARQGMKSNTEQRFREQTLKVVQELHLASPFFSLDEILITPKFLAPPPITDPNHSPPYEDIVSTFIPYTPDYPEMATAYNASTLDVFETLQLGENLIIIGNAGIGKTTTLAHIASVLARRDLIAGTLQSYLPIYLHILDVEFTEFDANDPLLTIINAINKNVPNVNSSHLSDLIYRSFENEEAVFMLDGLDELSSTMLDEAISLIEAVLSVYPGIKAILAASTNHYSRLRTLGFSPMSLKAWGPEVQSKFIQKWSLLWSEHIESPGRRWDDVIIDPSLLNGWLLNLDSTATPLEFTLKVWAAYAGDSLGPDSTDALEAYIRRMTVRIPNASLTLEFLASQMLLQIDPTFSRDEVDDQISTDESNGAISNETEIKTDETVEQTQRETVDKKAIPELIESGLLVERPGGRIGFAHPSIHGYFAGSTLSADQTREILSQPSWPLKDTVIRHLKYHPGLGTSVERMITDSKDPLLRGHLSLGRWLPNVPRDAPERKKILSQLFKDLQNETLSISYRIRVLTALTTYSDPDVEAVFRHLLNSVAENARILAVLGCGFTRDVQFLEDLVKKMEDTIPVAQVTCLALVKIGTKPALEMVASALVSGNEPLARAAAEAFATHKKEGYPLLRDGSTSEDLLIRRAVIYGLRKVNEPWATEILQEMQIEDSQWVIKDAAAQAFEDITQPNPAIPKPQPILDELPWLIAFAGDRGLGISGEKSAQEMLLRVLQEGTEDEIIAALGQIQFRGETDIFPTIYELLYGDNLEIKEYAFHTVWNIASMGVEIPIYNPNELQ